MTEGVSVIICCYNSEKKIEKVLEYLSNQELSQAINWEIILVDNNSKDHTSRKAISVWNSFSKQVSFKVVSQSIPGLNAAREMGIRYSQYEYILFCDDDNWLDKLYIDTAFMIMHKNPDIGILGGRSEAVFDAKAPAWFEQFQNYYAVGEQSTMDGIVNERGFLWGAGMVLRRRTWNLIKEKKIDLVSSDRRGTELNSGGDSELSLLALSLGYHLWYSSKLKFKHFITKERLKWSYLIRLQKGFGKSEARLQALKKVWYLKSGKTIDTKLNLSSERIRISKALFKNPYKTLLYLFKKEGSYAVLWYHFHLFYLLEIIQNGSAIESDYKTYLRIILNKS